MQPTQLRTTNYPTLKQQDWLVQANLPFTSLQLLAISDSLRLAGSTPCYTKKDGNNLPVSIITTETASYLLFKTHFGHKKSYGRNKTGTPALQIPHNRDKSPKMVYQLVSRDDSTQAQKEAMSIECQEQAHLAQKGISPNIVDFANYSKTKKNGLLVEKCAIFAEAFDCDLKAFDPAQPQEVAGEDPRPFILTDEQLLFIAQSLASHLNTIHEGGCAYRDLCLENVGITHDREKEVINRVFLCDFNTLRALEDPDTTPLPLYGHLEYSAPEYFRNDQNIDEKAADIYAYGILLAMLMQPDHEEFEPWEPAWINDFPGLISEAAHYTDPEEHMRFITTHPTTIQVLQEQEAYIPLSLPHPDQNIQSFLQSLIGVALHPNAKDRPTAEQLASYCREFLLQHAKNR